MTTGNYLSSARTTSLLVLVLVYVSVDQSARFVENAGALQRSREALARALVLHVVTAEQVPAVDTVSFMPGDHRCSGIKTADATRVTVVRTDSRRWRADAFWCDGPLQPGQVRDVTEPSTALRQIAAEEYIAEPANANVGEMFRAIEHEMIDERVNIAPLGFALRGDLIAWVVGPVVIGLLALMRNCTRRVLDDPSSADDEPWLVIDPGVGVERVIAGVWIASVAVAPWVSGASMFAAFAWRVYADGSLTSGITDVTLTAFAATVLCTGAWLGLTVVSDLIELRAARARSTRSSAVQSVASAPDF